MTTPTIEDWSKEMFKLQRSMFDKWVDVSPMTGGMKALNVTENVEQAVKFGEDLIKSSLELQKQANEVTLETQKLFWDNYFNTLRNASKSVEN